MASETLHEAADKLKPETIDRHRAVSSIMEELEAVDWYDQRVDVTQNEELRSILAHNRDEEKEHASMVLEWLRRNDAKVDEFFREYLFSEGSIAGRESALEENRASARPGGERSIGAGGTSSGERASGRAPDGSLGIGSLKGEVEP